jgi:hypothetical protein
MCKIASHFSIGSKVRLNQGYGNVPKGATGTVKSHPDGEFLDIKWDDAGHVTHGGIYPFRFDPISKDKTGTFTVFRITADGSGWSFLGVRDTLEKANARAQEILDVEPRAPVWVMELHSVSDSKTVTTSKGYMKPCNQG